MTTALIYGGDYNPEQWPSDVWREDARLMQEAGVNLVSLAIFSWAKLEPKLGAYNFAWLDEVIDILHTHGVSVNLATASASPPAWFSRMYPDSLPVDNNGLRFNIGSRQHYCPNSSAYRAGVTALIIQLAQRYAKHPAVVMWHANNEYGCHISECYCETCQAKFREFLKQRYTNIETLNESWGTAFWSQAYYDWAEINLPNRTTTFRNPGQVLDYKRFMHESLLSLYRMEYDTLRGAGATQPITTNLMPGHKPVDGFAWSQHCDVIAVDLYPDPATPERSWRESAFCFDLTRSWKQSAPWIMMEQTTTQVNWRPLNQLKPPGLMHAFNMQALARGADGLMFFQWRASRNGAEKYHAGMLSHYGPDGRVFQEVKRLGSDLKKLNEIVGSRVEAQVGILISYENMWAMEVDSKPATLEGWEQPGYWHTALNAQNISTDLVHPSTALADLSKYKLLVMPMLYQLTEAQANTLRQYVNTGGTLIVTYFSAVADEREHIGLGGYPAMLRDMLGIKVEEWQPFRADQRNKLNVVGVDEPVACDHWADLMHVTTAQVLATFGEDFFAGRAAITKNAFGAGNAYYFATRPEYGYLVPFLGQLCNTLGVQAAAIADAGVEVTVRSAGDQRFLFLVNTNPAPAHATLNGLSGTDLLSGQALSDDVTIEGYGTIVMKYKV